MNRTHLIVFACLVTLGATASFAAEPCCGVVGFDERTGLVTAVHLATKQQFQFKVNPAEPAGIAVGAKLDADLRAGKATIGGKTYAIVTVRKNAGAPCCAITGIDARSGLITARHGRTGKTFQFKVPAAKARGLEVGQAVWADLDARTADLVAGQYQITSIQPAAAGAAKKFLSEPCCSIKSIDKKTGTLLVLDKTTGKTIQVKVNDRAILNGLRVGQQLYSTSARDVFSLDGAAPCCNVH